jgi:ElaB/YqjD/DUF883 family membrane-anchored ribosome-binding protein
MQPRPESRISALEALTSTHTAHILELAADTDANFRYLRQDIKHLSDDMEASFKQSAEYQVEQEQKLEARLDNIEATMATKEDLSKLEARIDDKMAAMEARLIDAMKMLFQQRLSE